MPSTSEPQRRVFGMALSMKRGKTKRSKSKKASLLSRAMSKETLREFAMGYPELRKGRR